jgi:uncharacterized glyoxalase superfamily protein PhnB
MKTIRKLLPMLLLLLPAVLFSQTMTLKEKLTPLKIEHLRINVADKEATANWYIDNVGLIVVPSDNKDVIYVADKDQNFMLELSQISGLKTNYFDVHFDAFHLAFEGHKTIEAVAEKMLANGGTQEGNLYRNLIGDYVINVRDPNGLTSQLIHRVDPFLPKPVKSDVRFEHFAYNTPDQKIAALWYVEFMNLTIPWSKDIDTTNNNYRNYRVPYISDEANSMSLELFKKADVPMTLNEMTHDEVHIAFLSNEPEKVAERMVFGGGKIVTPVRREPNGDIIIDLVDPYNFPIRLIKRAKPVLRNN